MPFTIGTCPPERLSVVIADDSPAMREGLARILSDECDFMVANSAASATELRNIIARRPPKVLVMDLLLQDADGLALIKDLLVLQPKLRIVVFTMQPSEVYAARCLRVGARAYVSKRDAVHTLFQAIREAAVGNMMFSSEVSNSMLSTTAVRDQVATGVASTLTNRELQVFRLVGLVQPTKVIATKLGVSVKTVEAHRENIKNKLAIHTHDELVASAARWIRENGEG